MISPPSICRFLGLLVLIGTACSTEQTANGYWGSSIVIGIKEGLVLLFNAASNLALHPVATVDGISIAIEHWHITRDDLLTEWKFFLRAYSADPSYFVATSLVVAIWVVSSSLVACFIESIPRLADHLRNNSLDRLRPISRAVFLGRSGIMHRVQVLLRATSQQEEARLSARDTGAVAVFRRVQWAALDFLRGLRRAIKEPLPYFVYLLLRLVARVLAFVKTALRVTWRQLAYVLLPAVLLFQTWIGWSVEFEVASENARRQLAPEVEQYLEAIASLPGEELENRTENIQAIYATYREALLEPVHRLNRVLHTRLYDLDRLVAAQNIADSAVDLQMELMFDRDERRKLFLGELLFNQPGADEHGAIEPSRNWLESYTDERALLSKASERVRVSQASNYLAERIDELNRRIAFEHCIARYDVTELFERPLPRRHEFCGTLEEPNSVDEMMRRLFFPGVE